MQHWLFVVAILEYTLVCSSMPCSCFYYVDENFVFVSKLREYFSVQPIGDKRKLTPIGWTQKIRQKKY